MISNNIKKKNRKTEIYLYIPAKYGIFPLFVIDTQADNNNNLFSFFPQPFKIFLLFSWFAKESNTAVASRFNASQHQTTDIVVLRDFSKKTDNSKKKTDPKTKKKKISFFFSLKLLSVQKDIWKTFFFTRC